MGWEEHWKECESNLSENTNLFEYRNEGIKICVAREEGVNSNNCLNNSCYGAGSCGGNCKCFEKIPTSLDPNDNKDMMMPPGIPAPGYLDKLPKLPNKEIPLGSPKPLEEIEVDMLKGSGDKPQVGRCKRITSPTPYEYYFETCGAACYKGKPCAGPGCDCWG